jgi:hypothetical protein
MDPNAPRLLNVRVCGIPDVPGILVQPPQTVLGGDGHALGKVGAIYTVANAATDLTVEAGSPLRQNQQLKVPNRRADNPESDLDGHHRTAIEQCR